MTANDAPLLGTSERLAIKLQNFVAQAFVPVTFLVIFLWLRLVRGYRIHHLAEFRAGLRRTLDSLPGPLLICPNHLTMIDSLILIWAMNEPWRPFFNSKAFPWNTPERRNFYRGFLLKMLCYFGKCIPIVRQGPLEEQKRFLKRVQYVFSKGQSMMIFPEGTRSRSGKVDTENFTYGVGKLVTEAQQTSKKLKVLCVYLRGINQQSHSFLPRRQERFYADYQLIDTTSPALGLRAARAISTKIIMTLSELETKFFSHNFSHNSLGPKWSETT